MYDKEHQQKSYVDESGGAGRETLFGSRDVVVVSNRQPYKHEFSDDGDVSVERPVGGLTASLDPTIQETGGTWIAWGDGEADGHVVDESDRVEVPPDDPQYTLRRVWLSDEQVQDYYYGFSNQVLWPLCHSALSNVRSEASFWQQYYQTNRQFADAIVEEASEQSVVWLQDYHFALAPWLVRRELGNGPIIMQFWHIPWPSWDVFRACPHRDELLRGLLGNDVLGFHVQRYVTHFLDCVEAVLDDATVNRRTGEVFYRGGITRVETVPLGVPYQDIEEHAANHSSDEFERFRDSYGIDPDTKIAVGVDRLDYTKGILERLRALEHLWERSPEWRGSLTYVQNGTESRSQIPAYEAVQDEIDAEIDRINQRFATDDWQPVVRVTGFLSQRELYGLYRHADVGIVSPIRDGFNLVAEEYAAAQVDGTGALVLSTQAGVHDLIGEHAVSVSPFDVEGFADKLDAALTMPDAERRFRMQRIRQAVATHDLQAWLERSASASLQVRRARSETQI